MSDSLATRPAEGNSNGNGTGNGSNPASHMTMWTQPASPARKQNEPHSLYRLLHRALRGRYALAVSLAVLGASAGVYYGMHVKPAYRSEGLIRIPFRRAPLSDESEKGRQMTVFQEFLRSQVQVMSSERVIERAAQEWNAPPIDGETPAKRAERFARCLIVQHPLESEHLQVSFTASDPKIAASGVRAAINAYIACDAETARASLPSVAGDREEGNGDFQKQMDMLQSMERDIGTQFDPNEPARSHESSFQNTSPATQPVYQPPALAPDNYPEPPLTINQIAILDPMMRSYMEQQTMMRAELQRLEGEGGMDKNPYTILLKQRLDALTKMTERYAEEFRKFQSSRRNPLSPVSAGAVDARHRLAELRLVEVDRQMTELKTGGTFAGKPSVIDGGTIPLLPVQDRRSVTMLGGAAVGTLLPVGLLALLGLVSRRVRSADDIATAPGAPTVLGLLPLLPDGQLPESKKMVWSFCIHQARAILDARRPHQGPSVYLITSASPGEGKTRLTSALGRCFAESGSRTLLIDCDLISQGLTRRLGIVPARDLIDAMREGSMLGAVHPTRDANLSILPLHSGGSIDAMPRAALRRLLEEARRHFDIVLIDAGSVLGSIEASLIAPEVDGVILAVTRGQQQPLVEKSIRHLHGVGANVLGAIFNRAPFHSLRTSTSAPPPPPPAGQKTTTTSLLPPSREGANGASAAPAPSPAAHVADSSVAT